MVACCEVYRLIPIGKLSPFCSQLCGFQIVRGVLELWTAVVICSHFLRVVLKRLVLIRRVWLHILDKI